MTAQHEEREEAASHASAEKSMEMELDPVGVTTEVLDPRQSAKEVPVDVDMAASLQRSASKAIAMLSLLGC